MKTHLSGSLSQTFFALDRFIGDSAWTRRTRRRIVEVSKYAYSVLLVGPAGTGKCLIARAIHAHGPRSHRPFVPVYCENLPGELFASQVFGSAGEFGTLGCVRAAQGGTLYLANVARLQRDQQFSLLHTLRRRAVTPVSGEQPVDFDVRIIASSDQDLEREVQEGRFLFELYYRLNCLPIQTISLAARRCDVPSIARHFVAKATLEGGKPLKRISPRAMAALCRFDWPGNVMQLQRVIEDAVDCCADDTIQPQDLSIDAVETEHASDWPTLSEAEANHVRKTLLATNYDLAKSADLLGLTRDELEAKIQQYETSQPAGL